MTHVSVFFFFFFLEITQTNNESLTMEISNLQHTVLLKIAVTSDVTPYSRVDVYHCFKATRGDPENGG
jgi:hypothetical protein